MCTALISYRTVPNYDLIVAHNRDEFIARPSEPLSIHRQQRTVIAGRDLAFGGMWLGVGQGRRFALVTNYREKKAQSTEKASRGELVSTFLFGTESANSFMTTLVRHKDNYFPFNLLVFDGVELLFFSNKISDVLPLSPRVYTLGNQLLDGPGFKLGRAKEMFAPCLTTPENFEPYFKLLSDKQVAPEYELQSAGADRNFERQTSAICVQGDTYATRTSSVLVLRSDGTARMEERDARTGEAKSFSF